MADHELIFWKEGQTGEKSKWKTEHALYRMSHLRKGAQRRKEGEYSSYKMLGGFLYPICLVFSLPAHVHILELFPNLKVF